VSDIVMSLRERGNRRVDVLRVLKAAGGPMSIVAIADELGVHPNTVRFYLDALVSDGQVERVQLDRNRPGARR
jgi:predicted ArsR family transcriptional regulator